MEDLKLVLEIKKGKEIVNTCENEKTNFNVDIDAKFIFPSIIKDYTRRTHNEVFLERRNNNRRMCCHNELHFRKGSVQRVQYPPLPSWMQMHINLVN